MTFISSYDNYIIFYYFKQYHRDLLADYLTYKLEFEFDLKFCCTVDFFVY